MERLNALCESIKEEGATPLEEQLIALLEERGLLEPIVSRSCTGSPPWPDILLYHRAHGWSPEEVHRMGETGDDSILPSESSGAGDDSFGDSVLKENFEAKYASPSREHGSAHLGCQPGQFNDLNWREGR